MTDTNPSPAKRSKIPWPFIMILAEVLVPIVAAYVAYYTGMGVSEDTVNKGVLLQPPAALDELLSSAEGEPLDVSERKWRLLLPVPADCAEGCQQNLYTTRQVHIRLGEKGLRVERIAAHLNGAKAERLEQLKQDHPRLRNFAVAAEQWHQWLDNTNAPANMQETPYYLLVDQEGYAMMYYTTEHHGNDLLDDIKRVLRYTPE